MRFKYLKIIFFLIIILYHSTSYSKATVSNNFNYRYLSNYFSALLSYDNQQNDIAIKFFESSKPLIVKHDNYLKKYVFSLITAGQVEKGIRQAKHWKNNANSNFFEAKLLLVLDSMSRKNFTNSEKILNELKLYKTNDTYELIIYETVNIYNSLFLNKKIKKTEQDFGNLSLITSAFQNCYLNLDLTKSYFLNIINSDSGDYSRYLFFYLSNLIENKDYSSAKEISSTVELLNNSLLISQTKKWIDNSDFKKFETYFSCKEENDILSEFFFLISNLYSSEENFEKSNFYLNISNYLNSKFYFNLSLLVENYYLNYNYKKVKTILKKFNKEDEVYHWYKVKKLMQVINEQQSEKEALKFVESKFKQYKNPSVKILYDMANIYKRTKKYETAIEYYTKVLSMLDKTSVDYADTLYKRGGSYERLGDSEKSDKDLLLSLEIRPEDPYVTNYLAYSWLERNYKIDEAIEMLQTAYKQKKNDPYIIDSVGWGYFLIGDYANAEKFIKQAAQLMPEDPIVNDHYGDILWKLNRKIQAKYCWQKAYDSNESDQEMKKSIKKKLLNGLSKT